MKVCMAQACHRYIWAQNQRVFCIRKYVFVKRHFEQVVFAEEFLKGRGQTTAVIQAIGNEGMG